MITKTYTDILKEAAEAETFQVTDLVEDELKSQFSDCVNNMMIVPKELVAYKAEMVPVFSNESAYYVEFDNLAKYMNSNEITDVREAFTDIAEANNIQPYSLSVVIESKDYMMSVLESAVEQSKAGDKSLLESCELSMKLIQMMQEDGINVALTTENYNTMNENAFDDISLSMLKHSIKKAETNVSKLEEKLDSFSDMDEYEKNKFLQNKRVCDVLIGLCVIPIIALPGYVLYTKLKKNTAWCTPKEYENTLKKLIQNSKKDIEILNKKIKEKE